MSKHKNTSKPKSTSGSYNNLVGNLGNILDQQSAQFFGKLLKNGIDGALSFANSDSGKHVNLRPEKMLSARNRLSRAGLISVRMWPLRNGADYQVTETGFALVQQYWSGYTFRSVQLKRPAKQTVQHPAQKWVVVPPSRLTPPRPVAVAA